MGVGNIPDDRRHRSYGIARLTMEASEKEMRKGREHQSKKLNIRFAWSNFLFRVKTCGKVELKEQGIRRLKLTLSFSSPEAIGICTSSK